MAQMTAETESTDLWEPEPPEQEPMSDDDAWALFRQYGADPRFYTYTSEQWQTLEHWWLAEMADQTTPDLESELEYTTRRLVDLALTPDVIEGLIDGVQYRPILEQRAGWLAWEVKRRNALPEPPKAGYRIPSDFVRRLKDSCSLPGFLMAAPFSMALKQQGRDWLGLCPYHTEKSPSFLVHETKWHCFGCGQSGDVFDILLVSGECRTWREAVEYVASHLHVAMPKAPERATPVSQPSAPKAIWDAYQQ